MNSYQVLATLKKLIQELKASQTKASRVPPFTQFLK